MIFSGAKRPLLLYNAVSGEITKYNADRITIGGISETDQPFSDTEIVVHNGDRVYLTSDGFIDQNNKQRKRFGTNRLLDLLHSIGGMDLDDQRKLLEAELDAHQGTSEQRDDITFIGIGFR